MLEGFDECRIPHVCGEVGIRWTKVAQRLRYVMHTGGESIGSSHSPIVGTWIDLLNMDGKDANIQVVRVTELKPFVITIGEGVVPHWGKHRVRWYEDIPPLSILYRHVLFETDLHA